MKTKLLKKVRKRYMVDKIKDDCFEVIDKKCSIVNKEFSNYDEAYKYLLRIILIFYKNHGVRRNKLKT